MTGLQTFWLEPTGETRVEGSTTRNLYRRSDTGEITTPMEAPPGACWDATWMQRAGWPLVAPSDDGICLMVKCPDGEMWQVDGRASNCTRPDEAHNCWVRHGDPRECVVTVDKDGDTCQAGAGSIQTGSWHGFLRDGVLVA